MAAQFTIQGLETTENDLLGIWRPDSSSALSFSIPSLPQRVKEENVIVWSISLPSNLDQAHQIVQQKAMSLAESQISIEQAGQKLAGLSAQEEVSFAVGEAQTAESTLRRNIAILQESQAQVSFGLLDGVLELPTDLASSWNEFQKFSQQMFQLLSPTLRLETKIEEALLAYTFVLLDGDIKTTLHHQATALQVQLHHQNLLLTLQSRLALMQLLGQVSAGAAVLAAKFGLQGPLALPAAWRYIQDIIQQAKKGIKN